MTRQKGFTLIELAIALMVIGLLIGGVLKGDELIENARTIRIVQQIQAYDTARMIFHSTYDALPGDIRNPASRIPNCTAAPCSNTGNGNGLLNVNAAGLLLPSIPSITHSGNQMMVGESRNFWVHLSKAGLITGVDTDYNGVYTEKAGIEAPATPLTRKVIGVFASATGTVSQGSPWVIGNYYAVLDARNIVPAAWAMTGNRAYAIDQKLDDGLPLSGDVRAGTHYSVTYFHANCIQDPANAYDVQSKDARCNLLVLAR